MRRHPGATVSPQGAMNDRRATIIVRRILWVRAVLFIFMLLSISMTTTGQQNKRASIPPQLMTVADIAGPKADSEYYMVTFYQSARMYKLSRKNKTCNKDLQVLKQSKKMNQPVEVFLTEKLGDTIDHVRKHKK